jgi:hypothetical protein
MSRWDDFQSEDPSEKHKQNVFSATELELKKNREAYGSSMRRWLFQGIGLATTAAIGFWFYQNQGSKKETDDSIEFLADNGEIIDSEDFALIDELELLEDLEELEQWQNS